MILPRTPAGLRFWAVPSICGDFRLEPDPRHAERKSVLTVTDPTPGEIATLTRFMAIAKEKTWLFKVLNNIKLVGESRVALKAPLQDTGPVLAEVCGLEVKPGVLTVIRSTQGEMKATEYLAEAKTVAAAPTADVAVTVLRPTPSCPNTFIAREVRASQVLEAFCTPSQWESWKHRGYLVAYGHRTGHRYRLAHRHSPIAQLQTRICFDLDDGATLHFHDTLLPPAEEVLAAKLVLEHREPWLRNHSTCLGGRFTEVFTNPLGPKYTDGVQDAALTEAIGRMALGLDPAWR